jgi:hypothetical protein
MDDITKVLLAIVGVAVIATLVVNGTQTAQVISATGTAFQGSLGTAESGGK